MFRQTTIKQVVREENLYIAALCGVDGLRPYWGSRKSPATALYPMELLGRGQLQQTVNRGSPSAPRITLSFLVRLGHTTGYCWRPQVARAGKSSGGTARAAHNEVHATSDESVVLAIRFFLPNALLCDLCHVFGNFGLKFRGFMPKSRFSVELESIIIRT